MGPLLKLSVIGLDETVIADGTACARGLAASEKGLAKLMISKAVT